MYNVTGLSAENELSGRGIPRNYDEGFGVVAAAVRFRSVRLWKANALYIGSGRGSTKVKKWS